MRLTSLPNLPKGSHLGSVVSWSRDEMQWLLHLLKLRDSSRLQAFINDRNSHGTNEIMRRRATSNPTVCRDRKVISKKRWEGSMHERTSAPSVPPPYRKASESDCKDGSVNAPKCYALKPRIVESSGGSFAAKRQAYLR